MITVPEAARRAGKNPETIRRWIREGKLTSRKVGTQHTIEENDLAAVMADEGDTLRLPSEWRSMSDGRPMVNVVGAVRQSRDSHVLTEDEERRTVDRMVITSRPPSATRSRITSQGQITVPKAIRDALGVGPGDELEFEPIGDGYVIRPRRRRSILDFAGIAGRASSKIPATAEELDRFIDEGMAKEALRGL